MNALIEYQEEFNEFVDIAHSSFQGEWSPATNNHSVRLRDIIDEVIRNNPPSYSLDREDVAQSLAEIWMSLLDSYKKSTTTDMGLRSYLLTLSIYRLRDILRKHARTGTVFHLEPQQTYPFNLNLEFLLKGTDYWPLSTLNAYERYLIFLKFREEKTIVEIADIVQLSRQMVSKHIYTVICKLRRNYNVGSRKSSRLG